MAGSARSLGDRAEGVYKAILTSIRRGRYAPGDRLPGSRDLAREHGVSRGTVRKAIGVLAEERYVETVHGSGTHVRSLCPDAPGLDIVSVMYPFDAESLVYVQNRVMEHGSLLGTFSQLLANWDPDAERQFLVRVKEQRHRALLAFCSPREPLNEDLLRELEVAGVRVVHLEYYRTEPPPQSYILPDYRRAGYQAVVTLLLAGYGPIYLAGMRGASAPFAAMVTQGFTEALGDHDEACDPDGMFLDVPPRSPDYDYDEKLRELARRVPPGAGVVGRSSNYADLLMPYLREVGRRVPEDVGVLGVGTAAVETSSTDALLFGPRRNLDLALAEVTRPDWRGVRELVAPRHVKSGTVRDGRRLSAVHGTGGRVRSS